MVVTVQQQLLLYCNVLGDLLVAGLLFIRLGYGIEFWCGSLDFKDIAFAILDSWGACLVLVLIFVG